MPDKNIEKFHEDILDLQNRLEDLLIAYNELADDSLEEKDRANIVINKQLQEMDKDITAIDESAKEFPSEIHLLSGQIIKIYEDLIHAITETPDSVRELIKSLYHKLEEFLEELRGLDSL